MLTPQVYGRRARERERQRQKSMTPILKHSNKTDKDWLTSDSATSSSETSDVEFQENHQSTPKPLKSSSNTRRTLLVEEGGDRERTPLALKSSSSSNRQFTSTSNNNEQLKSKTIDSVSRKLVYGDQKSGEIGNEISGLLLSNKAKDKERDQDRDPPIKINKINISKTKKLDRGKENIPPKSSSSSISNSPDVDYFSATSNSNTSSRSSSRNVSPVRNQRQSLVRSISSSSVEEQTRVRRNGEVEMEMESKRPSRRLTAKKINYREPAEDEIGRRPSPVKSKPKSKLESKKKEVTQRDVVDREGEKGIKAGGDDESKGSLSIKKNKKDGNQESHSRKPSSSSHLLDRNTDGEEEGDEFDASPRKSTKPFSGGRTSSSSNHRSQTQSRLPSTSQSRISNSQSRPSTSIQHTKHSDPGLEGWNDDSEDELDLIGPSSSSSDSWKDSTSGEKRKSSGMGLTEKIGKEKNEIQRIEKGIKSMTLSSGKLSKTSSSTTTTSRLSSKPSTSTNRTSTSLDKLLTTCHPPQETPLNFEETLNNLLQSEHQQGKVGKVIKIGEASYSEVYTIEFQGEEDKAEMTKGKKWKVGQSVLKIIPILNPSNSNGKKMEENDDEEEEEKPEESEMKDVIKEISIAKELGLKEDEGEWTGFGGFRGAHLVQGSYPTKLMKTWRKYSSTYPKLAINPSPSKFSSDQLFLILHLPFGGKDLENIKLNSWIDSASIFWMTCKTLMIAEKNWEFEHRDLHWGNLLVHFKEDSKVGRSGGSGEEKKKKHLVGSPVKKIGTSFKNGRNLKSPVKSSTLLKKSNGNAFSKGLDQDFDSSFSSINHQTSMTIKALSNPETSRVNVNLIDFSLSRMECNGKIIRNDFEDPCLFQGKGDEQFQVYRDMKTLIDDDWKGFHPITNVLWLHYLTSKLIHSKGLRSPSSASSTTSKLDLELEKKAYRSLISVRKVMGEGIKYLLDSKRANASGQSLDEEVNKVLNSAGEVWKWAEKKSWWN